MFPFTDTVARLMDILPGTPYIVGGAVRDFQLGIAPKDLDLEVYGVTAQHILDVLHARKLKADLVGVSFAVVKVRFEGEEFDLSLPRTERKIADGHAGFAVTVDPTMTLTEALRRRDVTMNSMAMDRQGNIIDPFDGLGDIKRHLIRHTSDAFSEDPLRALRVARFAGRFGFDVHPDTLALCTRLAPEHVHLSRERIGDEVRVALFKTDHPIFAFETIVETGWHIAVPHFLDLEQDAFLEPASMLVKLTRACAGMTPEAIEEFMSALMFPLGGLLKQVQTLVALPPSEARKLTIRQLARTLDRAGLTIEGWHQIWRHPGSTVHHARAMGISQRPAKVPLAGNDLIAMGFTPGPVFSEILAALTEQVDLGNVNSREDAVLWLQQEGPV